MILSYILRYFLFHMVVHIVDFPLSYEVGRRRDGLSGEDETKGGGILVWALQRPASTLMLRPNIQVLGGHSSTGRRCQKLLDLYARVLTQCPGALT